MVDRAHAFGIYGLLARPVEWLLSIPPSPRAPPGDGGTTRVFRASPRYYLYRLLGWGVRRAFGAFVAIAVANAAMEMARESNFLAPMARALMLFIIGSYVAQTVVSWVALRLDYEKRWYLVTDRSLRIRQGVVSVHEMTITFANIQNLSITQGPLQRLFGISDLRVDTAGGAAIETRGEHAGMSFHTAFFRGVDNAETIRGLVQERLRRVRDAGLGDPDDTARATSRAPAAIASDDAGVLSALRSLRDEARALRTAAGSRAG